MAERRMFAKTIVLSDEFLDMPLGARCLYMTMGMMADDDGFVNNAKTIIRMTGATNDDLKVLIAKKFILPFEDGVIVIKHWRINNYLRNDRYNETKYVEHKAELLIDEKGAYTTGDNSGIPSIGIPSIDKDSIDKDSIDKDIYTPPKESKHKHGEYGHVLLKDSELDKLNTEYGRVLTNECITFLDEYIEMKGYKAKSHYLCIKKWVIDAVKKKHPNAPADKLDESYNMMAEWARGE